MSTKNLLEAIVSDKPTKIKENLETVLQSKITDILDQKKKEIASGMFVSKE